MKIPKDDHIAMAFYSVMLVWAALYALRSLGFVR